ncbi:hypothetical protein MYU51_007469 [Penicillium brevicompactum]|uniref:uncharacterized protein n=1 Tax=Penicillium brevicompactum TaxID=5074 RepID=UPI002541610B|nr:uncharacterized protein N7506_006000 [Penicillium brevicompactum]KAJ5332217.1 hypothetical protein N7506_006000 [Penicillium brevicompactum]
MSQRQEMDSSDLSHKLEACPMTRNSRITQREQSSTQLDLLPDLLILQQSLTLESIVSTTSSFGQLVLTARNQPHLQRINQIGLGLQGAVFEMVGKPSVIKKEKPGNEILSSNLRHEYTLHCRVSAAFDRYQIPTNAEVLVPKPLSLVPKEDDAFWNELLPRLPHEYRDRGDSMILQRILPLPKSTRRALINSYCSSNMTEASKLLAEPENKHCLARVYLGENNGTVNRKSPLRNFPLYLDNMRDIGIDTIRLASALGNAFAIMHWGAGVNGDDVEFVLGTTAEGPTPVFQKRAVGLFLLDFGQCDAVDLAQDREDVYQAFRGAMVTGDNQYFIPRPTQPALFAAFKEGYVETGNVILVDKGLDSRFDIEEFMQEYEEYAEDFLY